MDILDYAKFCKDKSFDQLKLNDLDIAMLTEMNYLVFKGILADSFNEADGIFLSDLYQKYQNDTSNDRRTELFLAYKARLDIFEIVANSRRFKYCLAFGHRDIFNPEEELQFAVTSFFVNNKILVIYRGTDSSLTGWKENFNMSYLDEIPSQILAKDYLNELNNFRCEELIIAGHSKGGNLALYAACHADNQESIDSIYLFDAPGLQERKSIDLLYESIKSKIKSFRPSSSIVGVLFDNKIPTLIVESNGISAMQHLLFLWNIDLEEMTFVKSKKVNKSSLKFQKMMDSYLENNKADENRKIVNLLYQALFCDSNKLGFKERASRFFKVILGASQQEREAFSNVGKYLFKAYLKMDIHKEIPIHEQLRSRRLFKTFFYFPEQIAYRSKWLAIFVSMVLFYSIWVLNRSSEINLLAFSCLYLLCLFLAGISSIKRWVQSENKFSFDYIPGIYSLIPLIYNLLKQEEYSQVLPRSILILLLIWTWNFGYQSYKIKPYFPIIAKYLKYLSIFCLIFTMMSYRLPSIIDFVVDKGIIIFLIYKAVMTTYIAFMLWKEN